MKILLTGRNGQIGWELTRSLAPLGDVLALNRDRLDLDDFSQILRVVREAKPDVIVNAAAYTAVDKAEGEESVAHRINAEAVGVLAQECQRLGALLVHFSTDYVFDGTKTEPYVEHDTPKPVSAYGRSKLDGEKAIMDAGAQAIILRTAWVYANRGKNFLLTMKRLARERSELRVVNDQFGAPSWARLLAEAGAHVMAALANRAKRESLLGAGAAVYHLTASGQTSWHGFAAAILDECRRQAPAQALPRLEAISTSEYPTPARRPRYSVLANDKLKRDFGLRLPDWREGLALCCDAEHAS